MFDPCDFVVVQPGTDPKSQHQPPPGDHVDGGGLLGEEGCAPNGSDRDGGGEGDSIGDGRSPGKRGERLVTIEGDPIDRGETRERTCVRGARPTPEKRSATTRQPTREADTDSHS